MHKNVTKSIILLSGLIVTMQGMADNASKDQAANLARTLKETPLPLDVTFVKSKHPGAIPVQKMEGQVESKFFLRKVNLEGHTIFGTEELTSLCKPYLDMEVTMTDIQKIAQEIAQYYREKGYVLAQVLLPAQQVDPAKGIIKLQVVEGILGAVRVEGGGPSEQKLIESQLSGFPIGRPFNVNELERHLISLRKTPGLTIQTILVPSAKTVGNTDLVFKVGATRYADIGFGYNNTGNRYTARHHMSTNVTLYNPIGRSKLSLSHMQGTKTKRFEFYRVRQTQLLGNKGTRAYAEFITTQNRIFIPTLNKSSYKYANFMVMHPLIYKRDENLRIRFALDGQNDVSTYEGSILKNDHIRAARLGVLYSVAKEQDFAEISGVFNKGLSHDFGARKTPFPSRTAGKNNFRHVTGRGLWVHKFNSYFTSFNMVGWQFSYDPLLATEEFAAGGSNYVRGYGSTETTADNGVGGLTELRMNSFVKIPGVNSLQFYTSVGGARVRNHKRKYPETVKKESLFSFAFGMRAGLWDHFNCTLQAGKPLSRRHSINGNKKWDYIATLGLSYDISKDWDKSVKAPDDPLASIDE